MKKQYIEMQACDMQTGKTWTEFWRYKERKHRIIKFLSWLLLWRKLKSK